MWFNHEKQSIVHVDFMPHKMFNHPAFPGHETPGGEGDHFEVAQMIMSTGCVFQDFSLAVGIILEGKSLAAGVNSKGKSLDTGAF